MLLWIDSDLPDGVEVVPEPEGKPIRLGIHADGREKTWGEERSGIPVTGLHTVYPASDHTTVA